MSIAAVIIIANNCLSVNLKNKISQIYRNSRNTENTLNVSISFKSNKQMLGSDCGLIVIANLVAYCFGGYD